MNIMLVSQCNKNALKETRRILDQFAERRGDRTWQTPITQAGLDTLRKLLRKTARKNTAVACHWVRGRNRTELVWIVGDAKRFNSMGGTPTNTTGRNVLRSQSENDWHCGEELKLLATFSGLLHDLGKACDAFQNKLLSGVREKNLYRHEWISLRLFQAFVGKQTDEEWLQTLVSNAGDEQRWLNGLERDGLDQNLSQPFADGVMPPLAKMIAWLVVSHHRLPEFPNSLSNFRSELLPSLLGSINAQWNQRCDVTDRKAIEPYWCFSRGLPTASERWKERVSVVSEQMLARLDQSTFFTLDNAYVMHLTRLNLMLADHYYSSLNHQRQRDWVKGDNDFQLNANTLRETGEINQKLDAHLLGVAKVANSLVRSLPTMASHLPSLGRHPGLRKRTADKRFQWQNRAFEQTEVIRERTELQGFFGVNMASTGCGKTLANARVMYALANPQHGARFSIALGLRTLTLQTGSALRERLNLDDTELAIRVGGSASRQLFEHHENEAEKSGSVSSMDLLADGSHVYYEGNFNEHGVLQRFQHNPQLKALLSAPVLSCTVDHLVPATEGTRGGRQIAPMLRLMSSDLVLDEIDDFDINDMPALTRLVHWAGLLGSRVLLSSATLPPSLVEGLFRAYRYGREQYQNNRGEPDRQLDICCAWFDEFNTEMQDCATEALFKGQHQQFVSKRLQKLKKTEVRRRGEIIPFNPPKGSVAEVRKEFSKLAQQQMLKLHRQHHSVDPVSGKRVSFGLLRMANIEPLTDVAKEFLQEGSPAGTHIHLCVYHSQFPLLLRSAIEQQLDNALNRRDIDAVFNLRDVRQKIDATLADDQMFVVLGSPVTEVGRDHDYDWAIVEPSSMRSLIQLAGRVKRHRPETCIQANVHIFSKNLKACELNGAPAYCKPGFETQTLKLNYADLNQLLTPEQWQRIDAQPRVQESDLLRASESLVDLEHVAMRRKMLAEENTQQEKLHPRQRAKKMGQNIPKLGAYSWYTQPDAQLTSVLSKAQPFRQSYDTYIDLVLLPNEDEDDFILYALDKVQGQVIGKSDQQHLCHRLDIESQMAEGIGIWGQSDYMQALTQLAESLDKSLEECAKRFSLLSLPDKGMEYGWYFHPALGFVRKK